MKKSLFPFIVGVLVGAGLLFAIEHLFPLNHPLEEVTTQTIMGHWQGSVEVDGNSYDIALTLKREGSVLSGILTLPQVGDVPCDKIAIDATGNITFTSHVEDKKGSFTGKLTADSSLMSGNMTSTVGDGTWSMAKDKS